MSTLNPLMSGGDKRHINRGTDIDFNTYLSAFHGVNAHPFALVLLLIPFLVCLLHPGRTMPLPVLDAK